MKDTTASLFGLGADAVPDDVLRKLSGINLHWWKRRINSWVEKHENTSVIIASGSRSIQYSANISISEASISLVNPQSIAVTGTTVDDAAKLAALAPCYIQNLYNDATGIYYIPSGATWGEDVTKTIQKPTTNNFVRFGSSGEPRGKKVTSVHIIGEWELVSSPNRNEYPDVGIIDNYEYQYLGLPLTNAINSVKIATGSYTGTGTYGASNPNSLTFDFIPKFLIIANNNRFQEYMICVYGTSNGIVTYSTNYLNYLSWNTNSISWYANSHASEYQFNDSDYTYYYVAFG